MNKTVERYKRCRCTSMEADGTYIHQFTSFSLREIESYHPYSVYHTIYVHSSKTLNAICVRDVPFYLISVTVKINFHHFN